MIAQINAGKMYLDGRIAKADKRKGTIQLVNGEDGLKHVQWHNRESNRVEDDWIVINDAYLEKVPQAKTGGVYVLRFAEVNKKQLFWIQDINIEKEEEFVKNFNESIGGRKLRKLGIQTGNEDILQNFFDERHKPLSLVDILTPGRLLRLIDDQEALQRLMQHLPEEHRNTKDLCETIRSAQIRSTLTTLNYAIYRTDLTALLQSLGLKPPSLDSIGTKNPLYILIKAIEEKEQEEIAVKATKATHEDKEANNFKNNE